LSTILDGRFSIELAPGARAAIAKAAALSEDGQETGGILLGRDPDAEGLIEVLLAAGPGPHAIRSPSYFLRDLHYSRRLARLVYEREGLQWVGDWHTHPRGPVCPSSFDLWTYAAHLFDRELNFEAFVAVIVTPHAEFDWHRCQLNTYAYSASKSPEEQVQPKRFQS
jgi:proteasome lid subunit RPN8/RPN11